MISSEQTLQLLLHEKRKCAESSFFCIKRSTAQQTLIPFFFLEVCCNSYNLLATWVKWIYCVNWMSSLSVLRIRTYVDLALTLPCPCSTVAGSSNQMTPNYISFGQLQIKRILYISKWIQNSDVVWEHKNVKMTT